MLIIEKKMTEIDQYNFYLNIKNEINYIDPILIISILQQHKPKFIIKIYNLLIDTINKSNLQDIEKNIIKNLIFVA
jgi:hypothetical protein